MSQKIEKMKSREVMFEKSPCSKNEFLQLRTLVILRNLDAIKSALKFQIVKLKNQRVT